MKHLLIEGENMRILFRNGFVVQHLYEQPYGIGDAIHRCGYCGLSSRTLYPLSVLPDRESQKLSEKISWCAISEQIVTPLEFISDSSLLFRYIVECQRHNIPIRLLFVESDYAQEVWTAPIPPMKCIGYEYNTIPLDSQIITDLAWYGPFSAFLKHTNPYGLFPSMEEVRSFKNAYDQAFAQGEIGDGGMETHIFRLSEVKIDDALHCMIQKQPGRMENSKF